MIDRRVVRRVTMQQFFVRGQKSIGHEPLVPDQHHPSSRLQNPAELRARGVRFEPVEGLAGSNEIETIGRQGRRFGAAGDAVEARFFRQYALARMPHLLVWFYSEHFAAMIQKESGEDSRTGPD